jgi:hypothetical protein
LGVAGNKRPTRGKKGEKMKKIFTGFFVLIGGVWVWGALASGCGNSNSATAPVTVVQQTTPTCGGQLGFGTLGAVISAGPGYMETYPFTVGVASKTLDMAIYLGPTVSGSIELGVYSDNSGAPHAYLDGGTIASPTANSWNVAPLTGQALAAGRYWLAYQVQSTDNLAYGSSQSVTQIEFAQTYGPFPSTLSAGSVYPAVSPRAILLDTVCP